MKINASVRAAKIRGTNIHSFRSGEWATIVGVVMLKPEGLPERLCFVGMYPDGVTDYTAVEGAEYEIRAEGGKA